MILPKRNALCDFVVENNLQLGGQNGCTLFLQRVVEGRLYKLLV